MSASNLAFHSNNDTSRLHGWWEFPQISLKLNFSCFFFSFFLFFLTYSAMKPLYLWTVSHRATPWINISMSFVSFSLFTDFSSTIFPAKFCFLWCLLYRTTILTTLKFIFQHWKIGRFHFCLTGSTAFIYLFSLSSTLSDSYFFSM